MTAAVLARALEPFPTPIRTLGALHLSTIEFVRNRRETVALARSRIGRHSMTSSVRASIQGGTVMPSALAVSTLTTSSKPGRLLASPRNKASPLGAARALWVLVPRLQGGREKRREDWIAPSLVLPSSTELSLCSVELSPCSVD
jgi:hypothetical protein